MRLFTVMGIGFIVGGLFFGYLSLQPSRETDPFAPDFMHAGAPIIAFVFLTIGVIFTIVGVITTRVAGNTRKLLATGLVGTGTIVNAEDTNVMVNEKPLVKLTLNVQIPGRPAYTVEHREVIPFIGLGQVTLGAQLPVAVDPTNPDKLAIDWSGQTRLRAGLPTPVTASGGTSVTPNMLSALGTQTVVPNTLSEPPVGGPIGTGQPMAMNPVAVNAMLGQLAAAGVTFAGSPVAVGNSSVVTLDASHADAYQAQLAAMRASGTPGHAVIQSANDLGVAVRGDKLMQFGLQVTPDSGSAYAAQVVGFVPPTAVSRAVVGANVAVRIAPSNPQGVVIDWDAA